jgi:hypothetical protein
MDLIRHTKKLALWTGLWVISVAISTFGPLVLWGDLPIVTGISIFANLVIGWGMVRANMHHVLAQDEMQQRIAMEAMGLTLGLTVIVGIAYSQLDTTNLISTDAEISVLVMFMGLCYLVNLLLARRRYS